MDELPDKAITVVTVLFFTMIVVTGWLHFDYYV